METNSNMPMGHGGRLFRDRESADKAVRELQAAGFAEGPDRGVERPRRDARHTAIMFDELVDLGLTRRTRTLPGKPGGGRSAAHAARRQPGEGGDIDLSVTEQPPVWHT